MLWKHITVGDQERVLVTRAGCFDSILEPGEHRLFEPLLRPIEIEIHDVRRLILDSLWSGFLVKERPEIVARFFTLIETNKSQLAMIYADGSLFQVLLPAKRLLFWRGAAEITVELVDVIAA